MTDALNASLWAVDADTGALTALPHFTRLAVSEIRNGIGKVEVDYPVYGLNFDLLAATTVEDRDVEVEVWLVGRQEHAVRGILTDTAGDDLAEDAVWRFEGWTLDVLLDEVLVWPQAGADKQELILSANTAGTIVDTLIDQAQVRGGLVGVTAGFTGSLDSNGDAWANVVTATFSPSATLLDVLQELIEIGLIDGFRLGADRVLQVWNPDGQGADRTLTTPPVIFRRGGDLIESPRRHTVRNSATTALVAGSDNLYEIATDATALARRGRRVEVAGSANSLKDAGSVTAYAQALLTTITPGTHEVTHGLHVGAGRPIPWVDYAAGDWVWSDTRNTLDRLRIQQLELEYGPAGYAGSVVLNTVVVDRVSAIARKLKRISSGTAVVGTSTVGPEVDDGKAPAQVVGVTASSTAYVGNDGVTMAAVNAGWTAVTTNADTSLAGDIIGYFPAYRYGSGQSLPTGWQVLSQVDGTVADWSGVVPGKVIEVLVAAVDKWGHMGAWSSIYSFTTAADTAAPPTPSTPVVESYLGLLTVTWNGLGSVGQAQPADFARVDVHVSTSAGFTPSAGTRVNSLRAKGAVVWDAGSYGVTYYAKLIAVDKTGNASAASAPDSAVLARAGDGDISALNVGKITGGTATFIALFAGRLQSSTSGAGWILDGDGFALYNDDEEATVELDAATGNAYMRGTFEAYQGVNDRVVIQPSGAGAGGGLPEISFYANPVSPGYINAVSDGAGKTALGLNSGNSASSGTTRRQTTLILAYDHWQMFYNTAPGDAAGVSQPRGGGVYGTTTSAGLEVHDSAGVRKAHTQVETDGVVHEVINSDGDRDGGYMWLGRGDSGAALFGKKTASADNYMQMFADRIEILTNGDDLRARFFAGSGAVDLFGPTTACRLSLDSGGGAALAADAGNFVSLTPGGSSLVSNGLTKSFVIPHPLDDPDDPRRWLVHGCTESPVAGVEYTGWAVLTDGVAVVELPDYFEALTEPDSRHVFLQPVLGTQDGRPAIHQAAPSEIRGGRFHILSTAPDGARVSWLVKAARKDAAFPVEPGRDEVTVAGTGPYRYLTPEPRR